MQRMLFVGILVFIVIVLVWAIAKMFRLKKIFLRKIIAKKLMNCQMFSTLIVNDLADYVLRLPQKTKVEVFKALKEDNIKNLLKLIGDEKHKKRLEMLIGGKAMPKKDDEIGLLVAASLCVKNNRQDKALKLLKNLNKIRSNTPEYACKKMCEAKIGLFEGDMAVASADLAEALRIFQKKNMLYEEAEAYFVLGTMYRVSGVFDAAEFMFRSAVKVALFLGAKNFLTEVFASMALTMSVQNRFEEAENYLNKAAESAENNEVQKGFVECQKAMLLLAEKKFDKAETLANSIVKKTKDEAVKVFGYEVLCRIWNQKHKYKNIAEVIDKVFVFYWNKKNYGAALECLYLKAEALFRYGKRKEAEQLLREIIEKEKHYKSSFFVANAYTLLGLLLLEKNENDSAKTFFNLALKQELCCDRKSGIAIDYANLAMVEKKNGNKDEAVKNLEAALVYAKDVDEDLYNKIKNALG